MPYDLKPNTMKYKRILLKLSGESLGGKSGKGIDPAAIKQYSEDIKKITDSGIQVAIVVGGGNIFRGVTGQDEGFDRVKGDQMGMLATVINSIGLSMFLKEKGIASEVFTSVPMEPIARYYAREKALSLMENGGIAIIAGGTGNPFFTTDSAAALRACEINADVFLKGTRVDGVYDSDPEKNPSAVKYTSITFSEVLHKNLRIMDATAFDICRENNMPVIVFDMNKKGNLYELLCKGKDIGTTVGNKQE